MRVAYVLLRCIGKAAVKNVVNLLTFGVGGDILVDAWEAWKEATKEEERPAQVEAIAQLTASELREEVTQIIREEAASLPPEQQAQVATYLGQVPASIRRSLRRPSDPTGRTTGPGSSFRKPEDLLPLLPARLPRFKRGDRPLAGVDWELEELLGAGGFGEVWKARNPHFDGIAPVALKFCLDPAAKERLLKHEARIINQVMQQGKHEGIVPLLHTYLSADPPCLAYEYIDGGDLAGLLQGRRRGHFPGPEAALVVQRLAKIVGFAHRMNPPIVHRDLKPANILVKPRPGHEVGLWITDFGIGGLAIEQAVAQARGGTKTAAFLASAVRGAYTPLYASPQQMRGDALAHPSDDVYALGVIWYQLLTGDLTVGRPGGEAWKKRLGERGMTPALLGVLASCFEDQRDDRPGDGIELAASLAKALGRQVPDSEAVPLPKAVAVEKSSTPPPKTAALPPRTEPQRVPKEMDPRPATLRHEPEQAQGERQALPAPQPRAASGKSRHGDWLVRGFVVLAGVIVLALLMVGGWAWIARAPAPMSSAPALMKGVPTPAPPEVKKTKGIIKSVNTHRETRNRTTANGETFPVTKLVAEIVVTADGNDATFVFMVADAEIQLDGERATIYDLAADQTVTVTTDNDGKVIKIEGHQDRSNRPIP